MGPAQIGVVAETAARIQESEELRGIALAPLETFVQRQPIVLAKVLVQSQADIIGIRGNRSDEIEILNRSRQVGQWDVLQQARRRRVNQAAGDYVPGKRGAGGRIVYGWNHAIDGGLRKIAHSFGSRGNSSHVVKRALAARAEVTQGEESGVAFQQVRNAQGPTQHCAPAIVVEIRLWHRLAAQRELL